MSNQPCLATTSSFTGAQSFSSASSGVGLIKSATLEDESLLRASSLESVLNRSGSILMNSAGSADTYALSRQVTKIDGFISHNWSTGRVDKFLALAMHFNLYPALFATIAICAVLKFLDAHTGNLFTVEKMSAITGERSRRSVICLVLGSLIFPMLLWTWNGVRRILTCMHIQRPFSVFLDKTCIHQTDTALKKKGIQNLAGFIFHSKSMLVVYTDTYLNKLWTVYELASFLAVHGDSNIVFVPTFLSQLFMMTYVCRVVGDMLAVYILANNTISSMELKLLLSPLCYALALLPIAVVIRAWAKNKLKLCQKVSQFRISDATCFDESDRPLVYGNIASFMRESGHADLSASEKDALWAFDMMVRCKVPHCINASLGSSGLPYKYVLAMNATGFFCAFDSYSYYIMSMAPIRICAAELLIHVMINLLTWPLALELTCRMTRIGLDMHGFCNYLVLGASMISGFCILFGFTTLGHYLDRLSRESDLYFGLFVIAALLMGLAVVHIYEPSFLRYHHPSASVTSQPAEKTKLVGMVEMAELETRAQSSLA